MAGADRRQLERLIEASRRVVVFTGAGVSTESGIPDFRSPGGLWSRYRPIDFQEFMASEEARRESWRRRFAVIDEVGEPRPNRGHRAVAHLVHAGKVACVITQNIDNLHQESGVPDDKMVELHGNASYARCLDCGRRHELAPIRVAFETDGTLPLCAGCGGIVKSATVSFGQAMPAAEMARAEQETLACDLFLVLGSSLVVWPAAGFPVLAKRNGAGLAIVNREPTDLDEFADVVIHDEIGPVMAAVTRIN